MPGVIRDWADAVFGMFDGYGRVLENLREGREFHNSRNGISDEGYVRPGFSVEIPLLWGVF